MRCEERERGKKKNTTTCIQHYVEFWAAGWLAQSLRRVLWIKWKFFPQYFWLREHVECCRKKHKDCTQRVSKNSRWIRAEKSADILAFNVCAVQPFSNFVFVHTTLTWNKEANNSLNYTCPAGFLYKVNLSAAVGRVGRGWRNIASVHSFIQTITIFQLAQLNIVVLSPPPPSQL